MEPTSSPAGASPVDPMLPPARGPLTRALFARLTHGAPLAAPERLDSLDPLADDDLHLALWCCYELHHHGFAGVDDDLEWDHQVLRFGAALEAHFEAALHAEAETAALPDDPRMAVRLVADWSGPPLSRWVEEQGRIDHLREFAIHRSAYQLKEADGHSWGIPRLRGRGRSAYIAIQADEYGMGVPGDAHCELFAAGMRELGLCPDFGAYVGRLPGTTLATDNLLSLFGLHRRHRGCLVGHLALFELSTGRLTSWATPGRSVGAPTCTPWWRRDSRRGSSTRSGGEPVAPPTSAGPRGPPWSCWRDDRGLS